MKFPHLITRAALVLAALPGCLQDGEPDPALATEVSELSSADACFTSTAHKVLEGTGAFVTGSSYGTATCSNGYLVDLNNYSTAVNHGTVVTFGGPLPTTETECGRTRVAAYLWRRESGGGKTYLGSAEDRGDWMPDGVGGGFCSPATFVFEKKFSSYIANNSRDFRIGVRALTKPVDPAGESVLKPVHFATVQTGYYRPLDLLDDMAALRAAIDAQPSGTIHPRIQAMWSNKGTDSNTVGCRTSELQRTLQTFARPALVKLGATVAALDARANATNSIISALCGSGGSAAILQTAIRDYARAHADIHTAVKAVLDARIPSGTDTRMLAANALTQAGREALGVLANNCELDEEALVDYVTAGVLPSGVSASRLMLGSCSGTASQVATNLGIGANFGGHTATTARDAFAACMSRVVDGVRDDVCNDPRASTAPDDNAATNDPDTDTPEGCAEAGLEWTADGCSLVVNAGPLTPEEEQQLQELLNYERDREMDARIMRRLDQLEADNNRAARVAAYASLRNATEDDLVNTFALGAALGSAALVFIFPPAAVAAVVVAGIAAAVGVSIAAWRASITHRRLQEAAGAVSAAEGACSFGSNGPGGCVQGANRCGADLGLEDVWYSNAGENRMLNQADRLDHCLCLMMDARYAQLPLETGASSSTCPSPEDAERQACLTDPSGGDDHPVRFDCLKHLRPGPVDAQVMLARICNAIDCPGDLIGVPDGVDGACSCINPPNDPTQGLPCTQAWQSYCTDEGNCGCTPLDSGSAPIGNDPFCRFDWSAARWPGSIDDFFTADRDDLFVHQHDATNRLAMLRANESMVSARIYRNSLTAVPAPSDSNPAKLRLKAMISKKPTGGDNIDLQIYVTSRNLPNGLQELNHDFMGQVRLNTLTAGVPTNVDVTLNKNLIDRAFSGEYFHIEYTIQAAQSYTRHIGIGAQSFIGATTTIPAALQAPLCPPPDADAFITAKPVTNPSWVDEGGTPFDPIVDFLLGNGGSARIPRTSAVIREGGFFVPSP